jgi:hypothetical protein
MKAFLAAIEQLGAGLVVIRPLSRTDPGFGQGGGGVDPDYGFGTFPHPDQGLPGYGHPDQGLPGFPSRPDQGLPGYGHPDQGLPGYGHPGNRPPGSAGGRPDQGLPVPPPDGVVTPPINLPSVPHLPTGSGIVVPLPEGTNVPTPTTPPAPGAKPYILWYGPGTQSTVVYLTPSTPDATPK